MPAKKRRFSSGDCLPGNRVARCRLATAEANGTHWRFGPERRVWRSRCARDVARHVERPILFPLSNPVSLRVAHPQDLLNWTDGHALIGTGSPFGTVSFGGKDVHIPQTNEFLHLSRTRSGRHCVQIPTRHGHDDHGSNRNWRVTGAYPKGQERQPAAFTFGCAPNQPFDRSGRGSPVDPGCDKPKLSGKRIWTERSTRIFGSRYTFHITRARALDPDQSAEETAIRRIVLAHVAFHLTQLRSHR